MNFPSKQKVLEYQAMLIDRFGGSHGLRDDGGLESALMAAENRYNYEDACVATCAATYAYQLSKAHAFIDGNKRIAAAMAELFIEMNDGCLKASDDELEEMYLKIADGQLSREDVEQYFAKRIVMVK